MRQSIQTHYIGPTDHRGSRIKAKASGGLSLTLGWADELDSNENHRRAALALAQKLGWCGSWVAGGAVGGGCVFVQNDGDGGFVLATLAETLYEVRVRQYEATGLSRSDAQAAVEADDIRRAEGGA